MVSSIQKTFDDPFQNQNSGHLSSAKYVATEQGRTLTDELLKQEFPSLSFLGTVQETGLLGVNTITGDFEVFVRHPRWVPVKQIDGSITYGGLQTEEHIIFLLGKTYGKQAINIAQDIIAAIAHGTVIPYNALQVGKELESVAHDRKTGAILRLPAHEQVEFQSGIHEDALPPFPNVEQAIIARTKQIMQRAQEHPALFLMDTSTPLAGSPNDPGMQLNNGDGGKYIRPWAERLQEHLIFSDDDAIATLNIIAEANGYTDFSTMTQAKGFQVMWPAVACQTSYGMPHIVQDNGNYSIPLEIAIATSDIFNSNIGAIADMLMASSPLIFGIAPTCIRDHRILLRYIFDGAWPSPFIGSVEELKQRWQYGSIDGTMYTIDRLAYLGKIDNRVTHAMIYGSAKIRVETKDLRSPLGRVENTIAGASPSLLDEIAHDAFLYVLAVAALEAVANGENPISYFGQSFPHFTGWSQRKAMTKCFNTEGATHPEVAQLIQETIQFLAQMKATYPALDAMIEFTIARIHNLCLPAADSIESYKTRPIGPISEVMLKMHDSGYSALEILEAAHSYQYSLAAEISSMDVQQGFFQSLLAYTI